MTTAIRIAVRELRGGFGAFRIFLACLILGVAAIAAVGTARQSIEEGLRREGAGLLGGDAEMRLVYRFATDEERAWLEGAGTAVSEIVDFRSMAVLDRGGRTERALTQVKGVDGSYPLIGSVELNPDIPLAEALAGNGAVMERVLADRLGLSPGDGFRLGAAEYELRAVLENEPDAAGTAFSLGPRTLLRTEALEGSGLLAPGTLFESRYRLTAAGADLDALREDAEAAFPDNGMDWRDSRNGAPGVSRFVGRLGAFLVLVGLAGLAVGGVGISAAVRAYLSGKTRTIATLKSVGASRGVVFATYLVQVGAMTLLGVLGGVALGAALPLAVAPFLSARLPVPLEPGIYAGPLLEAALYGALTSVIFTLWPLARTEEVKPARLFRDDWGRSAGPPRWPYLAVIAAAVAALVAVAAWLSGVVVLTLYAAAGIVGALFVLAVVAALVRFGARRLSRSRAARGRTALRAALAAIGGPREEATSVVLSLGLGLTVLAAVGQIDANLQDAIAGDLPEVAPSYFFVDIQPDQIDGFRERLDRDPGVGDYDPAPMLRGIITRINGVPAIEVGGDHWVLRGDRGVTYSDTPPEGSVLTAGEWWAEDYEGPNLVSFAAEEGEEIGLEIGDEITVNILGRDITAEVVSFREVDFSTAGIGFIIVMNEAALRGAPHTWISTVYAEEEAEEAILRDLAEAYPNITAVRVRDVVARAATLLGQVGAAIRGAAAVTLVTGAVVLIGAALAGERARVFEAAVMKTLGADRRRILTSFALRSAILGAAAGAVALFAGAAGAWAVMVFVMDDDYSLHWLPGLSVVAVGVAATLLTGLLFALRPLAAKPAQILRARE